MAALCLCVTASTAQADPVFFGPTPYTSSANSPFNGVSFNYFHLENFEDGSLNTPGVTANAGFVLAPSSVTDSVDADDGTVDGFGTGGRSFFFDQGGVTGIRFTFNAAALGGLPTHAGIVWTDGANPIIFEAFGPGGVLLGTLNGTHADVNFTGQTAEDRFYGVTFSGGISSIRIRQPLVGSGIEVDHLQYGLASAPTAVPEPTTMLLLGTGLAGVAVKAHRRRKGGKRASSEEEL